MGQYIGNKPKEARWKIHPIWRGIGCFFIVFIPIASYVLALMLLQENARRRWISLPPEVVVTVNVPGIGAVPHLYANLIFAAVVAVMFFSLLTVFYAALYRMIGPSRYGPLDEPPPKRRGKMKKSR